MRAAPQRVPDGALNVDSTQRREQSSLTVISDLDSADGAADDG
jgi:hypothetical protein